MRNHLLLFFSISLCNLSSYCDEPTQKKDGLILDDAKRSILVSCNPQITFSPHNDNKHSININNHDPEYQCASYFGKKLLDCMSCQSDENIKKNFKKLNPNAAKFYLMNLPIDKYQDFLCLFTHDEWNHYLQGFNENHRKQMPTLQEQLELIAKVYSEVHYCILCGPMCSFIGSSAPKGTAKWWHDMKTNDCLYESHKKKFEALYKNLKEQMFQTK
jgi:hypothetical protein